MYTVRLENTVTHQIYEQQVEDTNDGGKLYFRFGISTIDLADGEYILTVFGENGDVLAEDLLRIGDFNPQTLQYTKGEKTYLDITVDAILQREKNVSITDIHTRILPDLGNDAVEIVYVDAQPLYDSARSEGYDEGYDLGIQQSYPKGYEDGYNKGTEDGYNTGSAEAYPRGYEDGYGNGKTDGYNEGYGVGYGEGDAQGYENGYNTATDTFVGELKELYVDGNGVYKTKYSDDLHLTGEDFYDYAALHNKVYNTNMYFHKDLSIDIWIRFNAEIPNDDHSTNIDIMSILGTEDVEYSNYPLKLSRLAYFGEDAITLYYGQYYFVLSNVSTFEWMHIKINSATKEVSINGVQCAEMYSVDKETGRFTKVDNWDNVDDVVSTLPITLGFINNPADTIPVGVTRGFEDTDLGMVIIDGVKFIPTAQGYKRIDTDEFLEDVPVYIANGEDISYEYNNVIGQGAYKTVTVKVDTDSYYGKGFDDGYDVGYDVGTEDGYDVGYADGEQASFGNGYEQGQKDIVENARVLEITENGVYRSQYSEPPFEKTGDNFYNYAHLTNVSYDTGVVIDKNSVIEFWIKPYDLVMPYVRTVFSLTKEWRIYTDKDYYQVLVGDVYGFNTYNGNLNLNEWNHILFDFAKNEGLFNGEKITNVYFERRLPEGKTLIINGDKYNENSFNGYFGMLKINDIVFIPTENGFMNTATGEYLQKRSEGEYEYFAPVMPSGNLIKTVNVNIVPTIKFVDYGMKCSYSSFKTLPSWVDLNGMDDYSYMFSDSKIEEAPYFDTSKAGKMNRMYANCFNITSVPLYDVKNATDLTGMFSNASNLQYIPNFELGTNVTIAEIAYGCNKITKFPQLDTSGVVNMQSMVYGCTALTELPALDASNINVSTYNSASIIGYTELKNLTKAGGLIGLRRKIDDNYGWAKCPNLDYESCINILNGLFDFAGNGITPSSNEGKLKVHKNFLTLVGDEIIIGTNKGWTITS